MSDLVQSVPSQVALPDVAKSPDAVCDLPTGYLDEAGTIHREAHVRELTGEEEDILMSKRMQGYAKMQKVLENCTVSIGTVKAANNREWSAIIKNLTATDRLYLLIHIRMASLGNAYTFKTKCPQAECEKILEKVIDLADFKIQGMPDPDKRTWKGVLPKSKLSYTAKVQTGAEEEKLAKAEEAVKDNMSLAILARLVELGGEMPVTLNMMKKLGTADRTHLRDEFKTHEGKLDNLADVTCDACGHDFQCPIDVAQPNFFFPSGT